MQILKADISQLEAISALFDAYRVFYKQDSDIKAATVFIKERLEKKDSIILIAKIDEKIVGFTQLYPSFSSVSLGKIFILNDLYIKESERKKGIASALLESAADFAEEQEAIRIELSTHFENLVAQELYEKSGYEEDQEFLHFSLPLYVE